MRTPAQAVAWALSVAVGYAGLCLKFVREAFGTPARYATAIAAWNAATLKHPGDRNAPAGVPVFFSGTKAGHVALSLGGGQIRTTNSATGRIHTHTIALWESWGYHYLGWTEDLNGVRVYTAPPPPPPAAPSGSPAWLPTGNAHHNADVERYQRHMNSRYPAYSSLTPDGKNGPRTQAVTREWQRRTSRAQTGVVTLEMKAALGL